MAHQEQLVRHALVHDELDGCGEAAVQRQDGPRGDVVEAEGLPLLPEFNERRVESARAVKVERHVLAIWSDEAELQRNMQGSFSAWPGVGFTSCVSVSVYRLAAAS